MEEDDTNSIIIKALDEIIEIISTKENDIEPAPIIESSSSEVSSTIVLAPAGHHTYPPFLSYEPPLLHHTKHQENGSDIVQRISTAHDGKYEGDMLKLPDGTWLRHGVGVLTTTDGTTYAGEWSHNSKFGYGIESTQRSTYAGTFQDNLRTGLGTEWYTDGTSYTGAWQAGTKHGLGYFDKHLPQHGWFVNNSFFHDLVHPNSKNHVMTFVDRPIFENPRKGLTILAAFLERRLDHITRKAFNHIKECLWEDLYSHLIKVNTLAFQCWNDACDSQYRSMLADREVRLKIYKKHCGLEEIEELRRKLQNDEEHEAVRLEEIDRSELDARIADLGITNQLSSLELSRSIISNLRNEIKTYQAHREEALTLDRTLNEVRSQIQKVQLETNILKMNSSANNRHNLRRQVNPNHKHEGRRAAALVFGNADFNFVPEKETYFCGVTGCNCGISKSTFLNVASVLNSDR